MKKAKNNARLLTTLILLVLAFFGVVNVTYSYFTATAYKSGRLEFPDMSVKFYYRTQNNLNVVTLDAMSTPLYPVTSSIARGETFEISLDSSTTQSRQPLDSIGIKTMDNSCVVYIRFWLDVFIVDESGVPTSQENYGKYFLFAENNFTTNEDSSVSNSWCYFVIDPQFEGYECDIGNSLKLSEDAPAEMLGKSIKINLSFEAVQQANEAFKDVFGKTGDTKGYYTGWF